MFLQDNLLSMRWKKSHLQASICKTFLIVTLILVQTQGQTITLDNLGSNLILNPSFEAPVLGRNQWYTSYPLQISNWNCTFICEILSMPQTHPRYPSTILISNNQVIDLDSNRFLENVTQNVLLTEPGYYLFRFQWIPPLVRPLGKSFSIYIGSQLIQTVLINSSNSVPTYANNYSAVAKLSSGLMQIKFQMRGTADSSGVMIDQVELRKITVDDQLNAILSAMMFNIFTKTINSVPGSRVVFNGLLSFFSNFDRLELYYYHQQNHSYYATIFLKAINLLEQQKGILMENIIKSNLTQSSQAIIELSNKLQEKLDYKLAVTSDNFKLKNQNGDGFMANNMDFFFYELPYILVMQFLLWMAFKIFFKSPISKLLRKYCFLGLILALCFEGNSERLSFYFFSECKKLYSSQLGHKIINAFILYFYYGLHFFSFGSLLWFKYHYHKRVKYFIEGYKLKYISLLCSSIESGFIPIFLGIIHVMLLDNLKLQTILLIITQLTFIGIRIAFLIKFVYKFYFRTWINIVSGFIRILFITSFYIYEKIGMQSLINDLHYYLIIIYLMNWVFEVSYEMFYYFSEIWQLLMAIWKIRNHDMEIQEVTVPNIGESKVKINRKKIQKRKLQRSFIIWDKMKQKANKLKTLLTYDEIT